MAALRPKRSAGGTCRPVSCPSPFRSRAQIRARPPRRSCLRFRIYAEATGHNRRRAPWFGLSACTRASLPLLEGLPANLKLERLLDRLAADSPEPIAAAMREQRQHYLDPDRACRQLELGPCARGRAHPPPPPGWRSQRRGSGHHPGRPRTTRSQSISTSGHALHRRLPCISCTLGHAKAPSSRRYTVTTRSTGWASQYSRTPCRS